VNLWKIREGLKGVKARMDEFNVERIKELRALQENHLEAAIEIGKLGDEIGEMMGKIMDRVMPAETKDLFDQEKPNDNN